MLDDASLLLADDQARIDALDVAHSCVVQAPAGSGKTELLIQRYLRLLCCVDEPEEVLAITFTRKAANEMLARVNEALDGARDGLIPREAHRQKTAELAADVVRRDRQAGWRLQEAPRRMKIQTLDSFCAAVAASLPVSSGLGAALTTIADAEMHDVYRRAAAATLDWLAADSEHATAIERLLLHLDNHTASYIDYLARMLATRDQWIALTGSGTQREDTVAGDARARLEENIRRFIASQLDRLHRSFDAALHEDVVQLLRYAAKNILESGHGDHPLAALSGIGSFPGNGISDLHAWRAVAGMLLTRDGQWRKSVTRNDGFPPADKGEKKQLQEILAVLQGKEQLRLALHRARKLPEPAYDDGQWQVLLALFMVMPLAVAELRRIFSERGVCDHTEVAMAATLALGSGDSPGDVALRLDHVIRHILVDEMQDTSVGQYQLIGKLLEGWSDGDGRTLFCVGDPMQSIYRFRDAEVGRFLQLRAAGFASVRMKSLLLRRNFRSGANLVHWFNTVFSQVLPPENDVEAGAISFSESVPVAAEHDGSTWKVHTLFGASEEEEAGYGVDVIRECRAAAGDGSTALLVRSRSQLPALLRRLREAGIPYAAVEIDRLTELPEIIDIMALTRALGHDADRLAWLALLRGPWVGLTWADLHRLVLNDGSSTLRELLGQDRLQQLSDDGQQRLQHLASVLSRYSLPHPAETFRDRIEAAWFALGGPAMLQGREQLENVYRYLDVVEKLEAAGTLPDIMELQRRLDDERVSAAVDEPQALQVMTMHRAKGLEFDQVVLHALGRSTRSRRKSIMSWINLPNRRNGVDIVLSPIGPRAELENDPLHQCIENAEADKDRLELDRLLYVACTRARRSLHLIGNVPLSADGESYRLPPAGSLLGRLWPAVERDYAAAFAAGRGICAGAAAGGTGLRAPVLRRFREPFVLPAPPPLPVDTQPAEGADAETDIEYYWVGLAARHAGTIVHRWLAQLAQGTLQLGVADATRLRPGTLRMARELGVPDALAGDVCARVERALLRVFEDPRSRWLLAGEGYSELALSGVHAAKAISVVIDRVRIDDGVHWIIDYKTSSHEGGDLAGFLEQEAERYRPQLQRYACLYRRLVDAPVRTALYFPLLQAFHEVPVDA